MTLIKAFLLAICISLWGAIDSSVNITFLFAGDFQGIYTEYRTATGNPSGGVARMKSLLNNPLNIFVYVGNIMGTMSGSNIERVKMAAQILSELRPRVVVLGRNEFTVSSDDMEWFIENARNVILSANLEHKEHYIPQDKMIDYDGYGVIIIAYTSEDVEMLQGAANFHVANIVQSLNEKSRTINLAFPNIRVYIAAGCTGIESAKKIAEGTSLINIFMSACSPTLLWHNDNRLPEHIYKYGDYPMKVKNRDGKEVLIVHSFGTSKFLGKLTVTLNKKGFIETHHGEMIYVNSSVPMDPVVAEMVKNEKEAPMLLTGRIGKARVYLDGMCSKGECNLGNLIADAFVQYKSDLYRGEYWTDTPIALVASGNIKGNINTTMHKGLIMAEDLSNAIQDVYGLVTLNLKGEDLKTALEYSLDLPDKGGSDKFLQVSGIRFVYDMRRSAGSKIVEVNVRCGRCISPTYKPLESNKVYKVITMENVANGQFGHVSLAVKPSNLHYENITNWDVVLHYIRSRKLIAVANTDRISQMPLISRAMRWTQSLMMLVVLLYLKFLFNV